MTEPSAQMQAHLAGSPTYLYEVWKITARDGMVAAYANCSRPIVFDGVTYAATQNEPTRTSRKLGLTADGAELTAVYDAAVTRADLQGGRWADARIVKDWVYFYDPDGYGTLLRQKGFVGKVQPRTFDFTLEFRSLSSRLDMQIGELTSPVDRRRRIDQLGIDAAPYTHEALVSGLVLQRKIFRVDFAQPSDNYFRYGVARFQDGNNAGQELEIKRSTTSGAQTEIELQESTRGNLALDDFLVLLRGYDGTLETAKALGEEVVVSMEAEVTMPLPDDILRYQP